MKNIILGILFLAFANTAFANNVANIKAEINSNGLQMKLL